MKENQTEKPLPEEAARIAKYFLHCQCNYGGCACGVGLTRYELEAAIVRLVESRARPQEAAATVKDSLTTEAAAKCKCCGPCHGGDGFVQDCAGCKTEVAHNSKYRCKDCGAPLDDGEGSVFTVCSPCWDKIHPPASSGDAAAAEGEARKIWESLPSGKSAKDVIQAFARALSQAATKAREEAEREHATADRRTEALIIAAANLYAVEFNQSLDTFGEALRDLYGVVRNETATIDRLIENDNRRAIRALGGE
jgi:predicted  nucleic acid-binding Zn-ribbon protein